MKGSTQVPGLITRPADSLADEGTLNPHWLAFWKEVRRLAELVREREAASAAQHLLTASVQADAIDTASSHVCKP